jgi:hypothetical protein
MFAFAAAELVNLLGNVIWILPRKLGKFTCCARCRALSIAIRTVTFLTAIIFRFFFSRYSIANFYSI